jgi:hypothetical protein
MSPIAESTTETYNPDNLVAGDTPAISNVSGTLFAGQNLARGAVVGRITASGKFTLCNNGAVDGSDVPVGVLAHAIDASAADKACQVYTQGCFRKSELVWDASFNTDPEKDAAFDGTGIVLR